jgi:hypothetical protein
MLRFICILFLATVQSLSAQNPARPNVLFIAIDDLNDWVGMLEGHPQARGHPAWIVWHHGEFCLPMPTARPQFVSHPGPAFSPEPIRLQMECMMLSKT